MSNSSDTLTPKQTLEWLKHIVSQKKIFIDTTWDNRANYLFINKLHQSTILVVSFKIGISCEHEGHDEYVGIDKYTWGSEVSRHTQVRLSDYEILGKSEFFRRKKLIENIWSSGIVKERLKWYIGRNTRKTDLEKIIIEVL